METCRQVRLQELVHISSGVNARFLGLMSISTRLFKEPGEGIFDVEVWAHLDLSFVACVRV